MSASVELEQQLPSPQPLPLNGDHAGTSDEWVPRRYPELVPLAGKHTFNAEPPAAKLMEQFITPTPLHYVRNHGAVPREAAGMATASAWTVEVTGELVSRAAKLTVEQLEKFEAVELPVTMHCGVTDAAAPGAAFVWFEGAEDLPGDGGGRTWKYGTSIRLEVAMDPAREVLLAYEQNGEPLTPDHGFPVRVIVPGFIGGRMVKWLKRIVVASKESDNYYHYRDNRVLPSHVVADDIANMEGGGRKVTRVEVTLNGGATWHECSVDHHPEEAPPTKYGKYWCWCFWSIDLGLHDLWGASEIAVRAWDDSMNNQPEDPIWNLLGMMNNSWFRVHIKESWPHKGEMGLEFSHPALPGQPGGWMAQKHHVEVETSPEPKPSDKPYTMVEVRKHTSRTSAWVVVHGVIYDVTAYLYHHPGGVDALLSPHQRRHGQHEAHDDADSSPEPEDAVALADPHDTVECRLVEKTNLSHDVRRFRLALPSEAQKLGLPVGKHVYVRAMVNGKLCARPYTPTSRADEVGHLDLVVKIYFKNDKYPKGGIMSQYLDSLPVGESVVEIRGPRGDIEYAGRGNFVVKEPHTVAIRFARRLAMVAGGTGITPVFQVIQAVLADQPGDQTEMHLVYANHSEDDILLRKEIDGWAADADHKGRLKVWYVVSEKPVDGWTYGVGRVNEQVMRKHLPPASSDTLALVCGPPAMVEKTVRPALNNMGYDLDKSCLVF
ncbi:hypothetical protein BS78_K223100 [Paspalum vaginatum]|uniref:Nitrate reductase n=1 Tax=Paspalum vaginatum TaxID=158149 RepID=A0A9W8CFN9_9POAL|nr:hypothetical protein BS78_K223100 [Paspalum vaginatum]